MLTFRDLVYLHFAAQLTLFLLLLAQRDWLGVYVFAIMAVTMIAMFILTGRK